MIDGLKVTVTGEELREALDECAARYRASAAHWDHESKRTLEDQTEESPLWPQHMCKNEAARLEWRASVFAFLGERVEVTEIYRLDRADLKYIGLLPAKPELVGPEDLEDSTGDTSELGPYARRVCMSPEITEIMNPDYRGNDTGS